MNKISGVNAASSSIVMKNEAEENKVEKVVGNELKRKSLDQGNKAEIKKAKLNSDVDDSTNDKITNIESQVVNVEKQETCNPKQQIYLSAERLEQLIKSASPEDIQKIYKDWRINTDRKTPFGHYLLGSAKKESMEAIVEWYSEGLKTCYIESERRTDKELPTLDYVRYQGYFKVLKYLVETNNIHLKDSRGDLKDSRGTYLLKYAVKFRHIKVTQYLIEKCCVDPNIDEYAQQIHHFFRAMASCGTLNILKYLIEEGGLDPNMRSCCDDTLIHRLAEHGRLNMMRYLIERRGVDPLESNDCGENAFSYAADNDHVNVVQYLMKQQGIDPDDKYRDEFVKYLYHPSRYGGSFNVVKYMIKNYNIDINKKGWHGKLLLHEAVYCNNHELVNFLIKQPSIDINATDKEGRTALHCAVINHNYNYELVKLLTNQAFIDTRATDRAGRTALHCVLDKALNFYNNGDDFLEIAKYLIENCDVDINAKDCWGRTPIYNAVFYGNYIVVKYLMQQPDIKINIKDNDGMTPLNYVIASGFRLYPPKVCPDNALKIMKCLIKNGSFDINAGGVGGMTLLHWAADKNHLAIVKYLIEDCEADINAEDCSGRTPIYNAVLYNNYEVVEYLTQQPGIKLNIKDNQDMTPLNYVINSVDGSFNPKVCPDNALKIMKCLIKNGSFDINAGGVGGMTLLHWAADNGHLEIVKYLIGDCEADIKAKDNDGMTPLHKAAKFGSLEAVKYLIEDRDVDINAKSKDGMTPLHMAAKFESLEAVKYLIEDCKADINAKSKDGMTPLHMATKFKSLEVMKYLIEDCKADINAKDNNGYTLLHWAAENRHLKMVKYLIEDCELDINAKSKDGMTPLHKAASFWSDQVLKYLIEDCDVDINAKDNDGMTPLHYATMKVYINSGRTVLQSLINKANIFARCGGGNTALLYACRKPSKYDASQVIKIFLDDLKQKVDSNNLSKNDSKLKKYLEDGLQDCSNHSFAYRIILQHPLMAMVFSEKERQAFQKQQAPEALTLLKE